MSYEQRVKEVEQELAELIEPKVKWGLFAGPETLNHAITLIKLHSFLMEDKSSNE